MELSKPGRAKFARRSKYPMEEVEDTPAAQRASRSKPPDSTRSRTAKVEADAGDAKQLTRKQRRADAAAKKAEDDSSMRPLSKNRRADLSGEKGLLEFLEGYERVSFEEACMGRITHNQLAVWVHVNGVWMRDFHDNLGSFQESPLGTESWCRFYLRRTLNVSREDYAEAKKKLFGGGGPDLTGVYTREVTESGKPQFALVYRKPETTILKKAAPALVLGGAALAIGGVAAVKAVLNSKEQAKIDEKQKLVDERNRLESSADQQKRIDLGNEYEKIQRELDEWKVDNLLLREFDKMTTAQLKAIDNAKLQPYEALLQNADLVRNKYNKMVHSGARVALPEKFAEYLENVKTLRDLGTSVVELIGTDSDPGVLQLVDSSRLQEILGEYKTALQRSAQLENVLIAAGLTDETHARMIQDEALNRYFSTLPEKFNINNRELAQIDKDSLLELLRQHPTIKRAQDIANYLNSFYARTFVSDPKQKRIDVILGPILRG